MVGGLAHPPWRDPSCDGYGIGAFDPRHAIETVQSLEVRTAVISNSDGSVTESLREAGFDNLFEFVIDSHDASKRPTRSGDFRLARSSGWGSRLTVPMVRRGFSFHDMVGPMPRVWPQRY